MFHIYCDGYRITDKPKTIEHIRKVLFKNCKLNLAILYNLPLDGYYRFQNYTFIKEK